MRSELTVIALTTSCLTPAAYLNTTFYEAPKESEELYGGAGRDKFWFPEIWDSTAQPSEAFPAVAGDELGVDTIHDFNRAEGDTINIEEIDADGNSANGDQDFLFVSGPVLPRVPHGSRAKAPAAPRCT